MPTYNNGQTLDAVLKGVLQYTDQVIVVNDGSTDNTSEILSKYPRIQVVSYSQNTGKGWALRLGFQKAVELGYNYAITIDSDGQHFPDDLPQFLNKLSEHPDALIMGARNMDQASVPGKSSFGHKFSNFWYKVETGITLSDTQSGFRLYPVRMLQDIRFFTKKFEFEIEVLVRSAWRGVEITEVPVKVFYADKETRISHFRPFKDFTRISILNAVLVTLMIVWIKPRDFFRSFRKKKNSQSLRTILIGIDESPMLKACSIGFGVFMGIIPIWGFQLAVGIPLAFLFRLNKALFLIAANISIPPMIPLIIFLSHKTGSVWMGENARSILFSDAMNVNNLGDNLLQYFLGAWTLAALAGLIFGGISFFLFSIPNRNKV